LLKEVELAAQALHLKIQYLDVKTPVDFESAFRAAGNGHAEAMLVLTGPIVKPSEKRLQTSPQKNGFQRFSLFRNM